MYDQYNQNFNVDVSKKKQIEILNFKDIIFKVVYTLYSQTQKQTHTPNTKTSVKSTNDDHDFLSFDTHTIHIQHTLQDDGNWFIFRFTGKRR